MRQSRVPRPFIKWAGGKSKLLEELKTRIPQSFNRYVEPFCGGAALLFELKPEHAAISDTNEELVNLYLTVRDNLSDLIRDLSSHQHSPDYYYSIRNIDREPGYAEWDSVKRASRFIYLNKTCYNGLYRVNSKGQFNTPFGDYKNPRILDQENLEACAQVLKRCEIKLAGFSESIAAAGEADFVYLDPPYVPVSSSANFTGYTAEGFGVRSQKELAQACRELDSRGGKFLLSNSDQELVRELYQGFDIEEVKMPRFINSKASKRGEITELLVRNYQIG